MRHNPVSNLIRCALISTCFALLTLASCSSVKLLMSGGEKQVKHHLRPVEPGPYVLIFAYDGVGINQLMEAINSGKAPAMAAMLGKSEGSGGLYEHAYSVPNTVTILPSTTIAAWSAIFTGAPTAWNSVSGNEWFAREDMKFYAPAPVSVSEMDDNKAMIINGLVGKQLKSPTLFQQAGVKSAVSLNGVYRGADYFTLIDPVSMVTLYTEFIAKGGGENAPGKADIYEKMDKDSVPKLLDSMEKHGVPKIQVVYFPGIDLSTHVAAHPLPMEVSYLERVTDPLVAQVLAAYKDYGILDQTYVMIIAEMAAQISATQTAPQWTKAYSKAFGTDSKRRGEILCRRSRPIVPCLSLATTVMCSSNPDSAIPGSRTSIAYLTASDSDSTNKTKPCQSGRPACGWTSPPPHRPSWTWPQRPQAPSASQSVYRHGGLTLMEMLTPWLVFGPIGSA